MVESQTKEHVNDGHEDAILGMDVNNHNSKGRESMWRSQIPDRGETRH